MKFNVHGYSILSLFFLLYFVSCYFLCATVIPPQVKFYPSV
eukprot:UN19760